jgi:hypothetical protein
MVKVNGQEGSFILDLNESGEINTFNLSVESVYNGSNCSWGVDLISTPTLIKAFPFMSSQLKVMVNVEKIKKEEFITLKNARGEYFEIFIKPNLEAIREKNYTFKLGKSTVSGKTASFNIVSRENGKNVPWVISYMEYPDSYEINVTKTKLTLTLVSDIRTRCTSIIELAQEKSDKKVRIYLVHEDSDSIEIEKTD